MIARLFLSLLLIATAGAAWGQTRPASTRPQSSTAQPSPAQRAAAQKQNQALVKYADAIVGMIDHGRIGEVWDQASEVAKKSVSRKQFIKTTQAERAKLGAMKSRKVAIVTRRVSKGGARLPAGDYINVNFATRFANQPKPMRELASFHLDRDKKWRLSGYTVTAWPARRPQQPGHGN